MHQVGSHVILETDDPTRPRIVVPDHATLRIGTLAAILTAVARHKGASRDELLAGLRSAGGREFERAREIWPPSTSPRGRFDEPRQHRHSPLRRSTVRAPRRRERARADPRADRGHRRRRRIDRRRLRGDPRLRRGGRRRAHYPAQRDTPPRATPAGGRAGASTCSFSTATTRSIPGSSRSSWPCSIGWTHRGSPIAISAA